MKRIIKKILLLLLAFVVVIASSIVRSSYAATKSTLVDGSTMHRTYAISTTTAITRRHGQPVQTIYHVYGTPDVRSMAGTYYFNAAMSLTSPSYPAAFQNHVNAWGLQYQKQVTASSDIYCSIPDYEPTGTYSVYLNWSGVKLNQKVQTQSSSGTIVQQDRDINYVPCATSVVTCATYQP